MPEHYVQTNNVAELLALEAAIDEVGESAAIIHTDSQYSYNAVLDWSKHWAKRNWRTKSSKRELVFRFWSSVMIASYIRSLASKSFVPEMR